MHGQQTFPKPERLRYGHEFRRVYASGRRVEGRLALLFVAAAPPDRPGRAVGVVASRRVGNAVARNRARRLMREMYRRHRNRLRANIQLIMIARSAMNGKPYREVETALWDLWQAAGAIEDAR